MGRDAAQVDEYARGHAAWPLAANILDPVSRHGALNSRYNISWSSNFVCIGTVPDKVRNR